MWNHRDNEPEGFFAKVEPVLFPVALALLIAYAFLATPAKAEVDLDPTAVFVVSETNGGAVMMTQVPILNGSRYIVCRTTIEKWPAVWCLRPTKELPTEYGATIWDGVWEATVAVTTSTES